MNPCKVFLLDDHKIIRDGLRSILSRHAGYEVVGEESDPASFLSGLGRKDFDLIIIDLSFPRISGLDVIPQIKKVKPQARVVVLSMHNSPEYMAKSLRVGADCFLPKDVDASELVHALNEVVAGRTYHSHSMNFSELPPRRDPELSHCSLSSRELEVLKLMASGLSSKEMAVTLKISSRTVEAHRLNIMKKMGTTNSAETISVAVKQRWLD